MNKMQRIVLLSVISCLSINAQAHDRNGSLGDPASATDIYIIDCDVENTHVTFDMITTLPKGSPSDLIVSAELIGGKNTVTLSSTNNIRAESADIQSVGMTVLVHKNKMGKANFRMDYHCMTPAGTHDPAGTFIKNPQDQ